MKVFSKRNEQSNQEKHILTFSLENSRICLSGRNDNSS